MYSKMTSFKKKDLSANYVNWAVWSDLESICNDYKLNQRKEQETEFFVDMILININCDLKLPLNKIAYSDNIIMGITKPCTQLHPAPSTSTQLPERALTIFEPKYHTELGNFSKFRPKISKLSILTKNWHTW